MTALRHALAAGDRLFLADVCPSRQKRADPKASPKGRIHERWLADSRALGPAGLRAFLVAGFRALQMARLRVESVAGLIGIRMSSSLFRNGALTHTREHG